MLILIFNFLINHSMDYKINLEINFKSYKMYTAIISKLYLSKPGLIVSETLKSTSMLV